MTLGFTALTVRTAVHQLGSVTSLSDLVGTANLAPVPAAVGPKRSGHRRGRHRRLHRGRHRQHPDPEADPGRHRLPALRRHVRDLAAVDRRGQRAQPGLQLGHRDRRAARPAAGGRADAAAAGRRAALGAVGEGRRGQHRRQRRRLVGLPALLLRPAPLRRRGQQQAVPEPARRVQDPVRPAAAAAVRPAHAPAGDRDQVLRPVRLELRLPRPAGPAGRGGRPARLRVRAGPGQGQPGRQGQAEDRARSGSSSPG